MGSNYKPIGDYIQLVKEKNKDAIITNLLGINIDKFFMPSVANIVGTDLSAYKIVREGQFACNRMHVGRDYRIPIAISKRKEPFIVSPAYSVFEIIDTSVLFPEYLMMWFSRKEFDRNAWFHTDADVRGGLPWELFCELELPIPSIEKQHEIVKEYNTIVNRIALNEKLNQKLEETAQAIYKQWFVEFEFPNEDGKPYKSNGGMMVWCEELEKEIPEEWEINGIESILDIIDGDRGNNYPSQGEFYEHEYCLFLNAGNVTKKGFDFTKTSFITKEKDGVLRKGKLKRNDIILTTRGTVGNIAFYSDDIEYDDVRINSGMVILRTNMEKSNPIFSYSLMRSSETTTQIQNFLSGSAQPQLPITDIKRIPILLPSKNIMLLFCEVSSSFQVNIDLLNKQIRMLINLQNLILAKMTRVESEKTIYS